jgi:hypothetical protein
MIITKGAIMIKMSAHCIMMDAPYIQRMVKDCDARFEYAYEAFGKFWYSITFDDTEKYAHFNSMYDMLFYPPKIKEKNCNTLKSVYNKVLGTIKNLG